MKYITRCIAIGLFFAAVSRERFVTAQYQFNVLTNSFNGVTASTPLGGLIADTSGNLFGTTRDGGTLGGGTVFEVPFGTHQLIILASFDRFDFSGTDGAYPAASMIIDANGNLYGTTLGGGAHGAGTIFKVSAGTHALSTLASFDGTNGANPWGGIASDTSGNLYGTAYAGGANNLGTVFELPIGTNTITPIVSFNGNNGANPHGKLIVDSGGNLYGTTEGGGINGAGTVFKISADSRALATLTTFNFNDPFGANPEGGLVVDSKGNMYGTTSYGGLGSSQYGGPGTGGTVFKLAADTHTLSTLVTFDNSNGSNPYSDLAIDAKDNLFGTTLRGGVNGLGTVFEIVANTDALTTLVSFAQDNNGYFPYAGVIVDSHGNLFGTTEGPFGVVFELSPVPEPSSLALGASALLFFFAARIPILASHHSAQARRAVSQ